MKPTKSPYKFDYHAKVNNGEAVYVVGHISELGSWNPRQALRLNWNSNDYWTLKIDLDLPQKFEYRYFISSSDNPTSSEIRWEERENQTEPLQEINQRSLSELHSLDSAVSEEYQKQLNLGDNPKDKVDFREMMTDDFSGDSFDKEKTFKCSANDLKKDIYDNQKTKILKESDSQQTNTCQSHQEVLQENQNRVNFVKIETYETIEAFLQRTEPTEYEIFVHNYQEEVQRLLLDFLDQYFEKEVFQDLDQISQKNPTIQKEEFTELITSLLAKRFMSLSQFKNLLEQGLNRLEDPKAQDCFTFELKKQVYHDFKNPFSREIFREFEKAK